MKTIVGLDLSLRATAVCIIAPSWDPSSGSWDGVTASTWGRALTKDASERERVQRLHDIRRFVLDAIGESAHPNTHAIAVEQYAFTAMVSQAHALGELGGVVKHALLTARGIAVEVISPRSARKILLGTGGGKDMKAVVASRLAGMRAPFRNFDESDAFTIANAMRAHESLPAMTLAEAREVA